MRGLKPVFFEFIDKVEGGYGGGGGLSLLGFRTGFKIKFGRGE